MKNDVLIQARPSTEVDIPPEFKNVIDPIVAKWQLTAARVAADFGARDSKLPLNQAQSPEAILRARFDTLPGDSKVEARARAIRELSNPKLQAKGKIFNLTLDKGRVTFPDRSSIDSVGVRAPAIDKAKLDRIASDFLSERDLPPASSGQVFPKSRLDLKLVRIFCEDETNGFLGSEAGMDEIEVGGQAIDPMRVKPGDTTDFGLNDGAATTINAYRIPWKFNDGTLKTFNPPKTLHTFNLGNLNKYPATYIVSLFMAEIDSGSFQSTLEKLLNTVKDEVVKRLAAYIGGVFGAGAGGPLGAVIGIAVGYAVGKVFDYVVDLFNDVVFKPVTLELTIPSATAGLATPSAVTHFKGPGHYVVRYDWDFR